MYVCSCRLVAIRYILGLIRRLLFGSNILIFICLFFFSVNVSLFMSDKPVAKLAMLVGSFIALNMESSPMAQCRLTRQLEMTPSALFSLRPVLANTCQEPSLLIWSHLLLMKCELERIVNCSTQSNLLLAKKMLPTIMQEGTTLSARKLSIWFWTEFANCPINALACKDS